MKKRLERSMSMTLMAAAILLAGACSDGGGSGDAAEDLADMAPDSDAQEQDAGETADPRPDEMPGEVEVPDQTDPIPDGADVTPDQPQDNVVDIPTDTDFDSLTPEQRCILSGGTVGTQFCCMSTGDFPNLCGTGPCGCAPDSSHEVQVCQCAEGCFNGTECWLE